MLFIVSEVTLGPKAAASEPLENGAARARCRVERSSLDDRGGARVRGKMPALLAHRPDVSAASESLGPVRSVRGRHAKRDGGRDRGMMPDQPEQREHEQAAGFPAEVVAAPVVDAGSAAVAGTGAAKTTRKPTELLIMLAVVVVDQLSKEIVRRTLPLHGEPAQIIPGFLDLTHVAEHRRRVRAAECRRLSLQDGGDDRHCGHRADCHRRLRDAARLSRAAGAVRAVAHPRRRVRQPHRSRDRRARRRLRRRVLGTTHFWAFNVADAAITVGAILVLLDMIGLGRSHASHPV